MEIVPQIVAHLDKSFATNSNLKNEIKAARRLLIQQKRENKRRKLAIKEGKAFDTHEKS